MTGNCIAVTLLTSVQGINLCGCRKLSEFRAQKKGEQSCVDVNHAAKYHHPCSHITISLKEFQNLNGVSMGLT